jgi:DNA (cytosine-5)-methyltransferase 1
MNLKEQEVFENISGKRKKGNQVENYEIELAEFTHVISNKLNVKKGKTGLPGMLNSKDYEINESDKISLFSDSFIQQLLFEINNVPFQSQPKTHFSFIDLFAGIGGFRLAMQNLGGKCLYSSEWNEDAKMTYFANFGEVPFGDITKDIVKSYIKTNFDILCAGFPCQAFSIAGYQKGFSDTRGTLFFDIEQIIELHRPKVVFLENVKNLVSHDKGKTFKIILEILSEKLGYKVFHKVLNSMTHANIPQNRERIFIVAFDPNQVKNNQEFKFPDEIDLSKKVKDFLEKEKQDPKYYYSKNHQYYPELEKCITSKDTVYQWRRKYVRENKSKVCPTLTANMGAGGHNVPLILDDFGIRKLTPKECFSLQGFPMDKFKLPLISDSKLYMQAGNSVTTTLIERISIEIIKVL